MKIRQLVPLFLLAFLSRGEAAFSAATRCPCAGSLATERPTIEEAVRTSDVVLFGKIVGLQPGLRGTMNASLVSIHAYKGRTLFLSRVENCTNFSWDAGLGVPSLFFFVQEPAGNLALRCMSPLGDLHSATDGHLPALLDFVRDLGKRKWRFFSQCESLGYYVFFVYYRFLSRNVILVVIWCVRA